LGRQITQFGTYHPRRPGNSAKRLRDTVRLRTISGVNSRRDSATRYVIAIVTVGLAAFLVVVYSGVLVTQRLGEQRAIDQARTATETEARLVESRISDRVVNGHAPALARLERMVHDSVLTDKTVKRVKIWKVEDGVGEIIYANDLRLFGTTERLGDDELEVLETGAVEAEPSDMDAEENRFEQELGPLTEVYTRVMTDDGTRLLFETYRSSAQIADSGRDIARSFIPVLVLTLLVASVIEVALAAVLIRRLRRNLLERETLMEEAVQASFRERRRIAADLHDGPVQEMAGLSFGLAAQAEAATDAGTRDALLQAAGAVRSSVRTLRSAIVGVYPPNLAQMGLEAALSDLLARLPTQEIRAHLTYQLDRDLDHRASELLYRTSQEAIRNVEKHAGAANVWVSVQRQNGRVELSVRDDGRGGASVNDQLGDAGRFGLAVLADIVNDAGGRMRLTSNGTGTTVEVEVPV
jgi:two-component system, NarL family, sensor kinase